MDAMHGLFGFTESFVANHPCRFCMIHEKAMQTTLPANGGIFEREDVAWPACCRGS